MSTDKRNKIQHNRREKRDNMHIFDFVRVYSLIAVLGGAGYFSLELLFRGFSHWSMALCGAICLCFIYWVGTHLWGAALWKLACLCALFITTAELIFGDVFNLLLSCGVWDYTGLPFSFFGQICLPFSFLWLALSFPCLLLCRQIRFFIR